jgi:hypothetical protein
LIRLWATTYRLRRAVRLLGKTSLGKRTPYLLYVYSLTTFNAGSFKVRIYDLLKTSKQEEEAEKSDSMMQVTFCLVGRN